MQVCVPVDNTTKVKMGLLRATEREASAVRWSLRCSFFRAEATIKHLRGCYSTAVMKCRHEVAGFLHRVRREEANIIHTARLLDIVWRTDYRIRRELIRIDERIKVETPTGWDNFSISPLLELLEFGITSRMKGIYAFMTGVEFKLERFDGKF